MISADVVKDANTGIAFSPTDTSTIPQHWAKTRTATFDHLRLKMDIEYSPLAGDSWAGIERMLTPRIVHLTQRQMIWGCASGWHFDASGIEDRPYGSAQSQTAISKTDHATICH
jgi:hypothetical protein